MSIVLLLKPKHSIGPETLKKKLSQLKLRKACSCLTEQAPQVMLMYLDLQSLFEAFISVKQPISVQLFKLRSL